MGEVGKEGKVVDNDNGVGAISLLPEQIAVTDFSTSTVPSTALPPHFGMYHSGFMLIC